MQPDTIELIPLEQIDAEALSRDRIAKDGAAMDELQNSILANGLRMPIEVFQFDQANGNQQYGLISGFRRVEAFTNLQTLLGSGFDAIPAIIRHPESIAAACTAMVEENSVRLDISPYERSRVAVLAVERGIFPSIDAAIATLYKSASESKRARIRSLTLLSEELDGCLRSPELLSQRQATRICAALRADFGDVLRVALQSSKDRGPDAQWETILPLLLEAEMERRDPPPPQRPGYPKRVIRPHPGVTVWREMTRNGWVLHFTGPEARGWMLNSVMEEIERQYGPA